MARYETEEHIFECFSEPIDVTSSHRPNTAWHFVDKRGHHHRWYANGKPATEYDPSAEYATPTLAWKKTSVGYYEDGDTYDIGHWQCRKCKSRVEPEYCADEVHRYMPGLTSFYIDGRQVTPEEFDKRAAEYRKSHYAHVPCDTYEPEP